MNPDEEMRKSIEDTLDVFESRARSRRQTDAKAADQRHKEQRVAPMKINVTFQVEVDPEKWMASNGLSARSEIREDVFSYLLNHVQCAAMIEETDGEVRLKR